MWAGSTYTNPTSYTVAAWYAPDHVGNLRVVPTPTAMRVARDESGYGKVDPAMALFNAEHLMSLNPEAEGLGYSATHGLLIVSV